MLPIIDFSSRFTVTNTAYNATNKYRYEAPAGRYALIREISVAGDSNFLSDGRFQAFLSGVSITSEAGALTEVNAQTNFTVRFGDDDLFIIGPSEALEVLLRVAAAVTARVQVLMTGIMLTEAEYRALLAKKGLI